MIKFIEIWNFIKSFLSPKKEISRDKIQINSRGNQNIVLNNAKEVNFYNYPSEPKDIKSKYDKGKSNKKYE